MVLKLLDTSEMALPFLCMFLFVIVNSRRYPRLKICRCTSQSLLLKLLPPILLLLNFLIVKNLSPKSSV